MANEARQALEQRAQQAIINNAIFRWESAAVIGLTLILTAVATLGDSSMLLLPWWTWLLGGVLAEAGLIYSSLTDTEANRKVVAKMLQNEFHPERLKNKQLQAQVEEAFDYRSRIASVVREKPDGILKDELLQTASQMDEWIEEIFDLAQRLDRFQDEREIHQRNRHRANKRVRELQAQLNQEKNPAIRQEIEHSIASQTRQLDTVIQLEDAMERARLRLENTIIAMGTIYTQTTLVGAKDIDSGRAKRLRDDIAEEVSELADVLTAMDEVYSVETL